MPTADSEARPPPPRLIVGVGASAGGLDACRKFLETMPARSGVGVVVILHLDPTHESHLGPLLKNATEMSVVQISREQPVAADRVYVIAPDMSLEIQGGVLRPRRPRDRRHERRPIDAFFSSLAVDQKERAVGVVLSGMGEDGSAGLQKIKAAGGLCLVQEPESAEHDSMPRNAIATGLADHVLPPGEMAQILLARGVPASAAPAGAPEEGAEPVPPEEVPDEFSSILDRLSERYQLDFRAYKKPTLQRRTQRRMDLLKIRGWREYLAHLDRNPEELEALYGDLLIGVTRFFRDPDVWKYLEEEIVPRLLEEADQKREAAVRIWVPGCATGEEAYSLAMLFLERLERFKPRPSLRVFATDVDDRALAFARRGLYSARVAEDLSPARLGRFFHYEGDYLRVARQLRESLTFARHNFLADPPFSRLDLVSCRNVLIYLRQPAQEQALELFQYALRPGGVLVLGSSETIGRRSDLFEAASKHLRVFRATGSASGRPRPLPRWSANRANRPVLSEVPLPARPQAPKTARVVEQMVLSRYTDACVVIDEDFEILNFYGPTEDYLVQPTGEARLDLLSWVRPGLYPRLRMALREAVERKERVERADLRIERGQEAHRVACTIEPVRTAPGAEALFLVAFRDVAAIPDQPEAPLPREAEEPVVRQLEEELRETRGELQNTIEHLENANEEYRASHEELLSLNEELQSSNEELETSKEELQSLNEEMVTINRQLEDKNAELQTLNTHLNNLLVSTRIPTIFLNRRFEVRWFSPAATDVMRLVPSDVGRSIEHIKQRFRDGSLLADAEKVLKDLVPATAEVSTEDGRWYVRQIQPYRTEDDRIDGVCVTFNDVTAQKRATDESEEARRYAESIVRTLRTPLVILREDARVVSANRSFYETFQVEQGETEGVSLYELGNRQWDIPRLRELLEQVLPREEEIRDYDVEHEFENIGRRFMRLDALVMHQPGREGLILLSIEDVTDLRAAEAAAKERAEELAQEHRRKDEFLAMLGHELRNPLAALAHGLELLGAARDAARAEEIRSGMTRQVKRIGRQLDELLDVSRVIAGKIQLQKKPVDLAGVVAAARETLAPLLEESPRDLAVSAPDPGTVFVEGDEVRLTQILENLLTNAVKYSEDGGHIRLEVEPDAETVRIRVRDDGIGMDAEFLSHVFDLFSQAPRTLARSKGGMGLGLPLLRHLVELHGGSVDVSSPGLGAGSEFVVTLPRLRAGEAEVSGEAGGEAPGAASVEAPRRVLIVDDEELGARMLAELLRLRGHEVLAVHAGPSALEVMPTFRPDVVLLDLGLPEMDGYQVARRIRAEQSDGEPVLVALTGYEANGERLDASGFDGHLLKPPDLEKLSAYLKLR